MKKYHLLALVLLIALVAFKSSKKYRGYLPSSIYPGTFSSTTRLPYNNEDGLIVPLYQGLEDSKIFLIEKTDLFDSVNQEFLNQTMILPPKYGSKLHYHPGMVAFIENMLVDEVEVTNIDWKQFLHHVKIDSGATFFISMLPEKSVQPVKDYYTNPFFRFYPVVGISHYQATEYCKWRTRVFNERLTDENFKVEVRLPTESEWEILAGAGFESDTFWLKTENFKTRMKVLNKSGSYFKIKNDLKVSVDEINELIKSFNKEEKEYYNLNCKQKLPYFLTQTTPNYAYNIPINSYGLYNVFGNVAEMVREKGIAKGGSYKHEFQDCLLESRIKYTEPTSYIGFRAVCEVKH